MEQKGERLWGDRGKGFEHKRKGREENEVLGNQREGTEEIGDAKGEALYRSYTEREKERALSLSK